MIEFWSHPPAPMMMVLLLYEFLRDSIPSFRDDESRRNSRNYYGVDLAGGAAPRRDALLDEMKICTRICTYFNLSDFITLHTGVGAFVVMH